ncbi:MAG: RNA polymerase sigma factor [Chloroflexota bacterium]
MQLIRRSRAGDQEAFAALFERYKNLVYKTAFLVLGNAAEAEDALQEVFVLVHKSLAGFDPSRGAFTTWLYRVTINCCLNQRRKCRLTCVPLDEAPLAQLEAPTEGDLAEQDALRQALEELTSNQRAVIVLRYHAELPYAEIARVLDVPLGTVKSRLDLALKALRRVYVRQEEAAALSPAAKVEVCR